jgi:hypothetical protein
MPPLLTTPTFSVPASPLAAQYVAASAMTSRATLDIRAKFGAKAFLRIGRHTGTVLSAAAKVYFRASPNNDGAINPSSPEFTSSTAAPPGNTTLAASAAVGDTTITLTSGTGFAAGDKLCLHSDDTAGTRIEFAEVFSKSGAVLTLTAPLKLAHNSADRVTNGADIFSPRWFPGGSTYVVRGLNLSDQGLLMEIIVEQYDNDSTS